MSGSANVSFIDQMIDESAKSVRKRLAKAGFPRARLPRTRAQQRAHTRRRLINATIECLVEEGYPALTTRRIAERAGVAQSTLMHHFSAREELIVAAVTQQAQRFATEALEQIDLSAFRTPEHRERVLDQAWTHFTSPEALAVVQLWLASTQDPDLLPLARAIEERIDDVIERTAGALFPDQSQNPRFPALIDSTYFLIRGLLAAIPVIGLEAATERWQKIKPNLLAAAAGLLD